jgi:hypothetical protein
MSISLIVDKTEIFTYFLFGNINVTTPTLRSKCHTWFTETVNKEKEVGGFELG